MERAGFEPAYGNPGQIYSLLPLTTRPPLQAVRRAKWRPQVLLSTATEAQIVSVEKLERVKGIEPSS